MADATQTFDLVDLGRFAYGLRRGIRMAAVGVMFGLASAVLLVASINLERGSFERSWQLPYLLSYVGLIAGTAVCFWGVRVLGPGASNVTVGAEQLTFRYPGGRIDSLRWLDPAFRLDLWDWSSGSTLIPAFMYYEAELRHRPRTQLTDSAFRAILESAREHGMTVTSRRVSARRYGTAGEHLMIRSSTTS